MTLTDWLVSYYKFDTGSWTTAFDSVGTNDWTLSDTRIWTTDWKINWWADFSQWDDVINWGNILNDVFQNDFSVSFWFNLPDLDSDYPLFGKWWDWTTRVFSIWTGGSWWWSRWTGLDKLWLRHTEDWTETLRLETITIQTNTWYHCVLTKWDFWKRLYVNSVLEWSSTVPQSTINDTQMSAWAWYFDSTTPEDYNDSNIDEIWIWNRALTSSEVSELYNNWDGLQYPFTTPTKKWNIFFWFGA